MPQDRSETEVPWTSLHVQVKTCRQPTASKFVKLVSLSGTLSGWGCTCCLVLNAGLSPS